MNMINAKLSHRERVEAARETAIRVEKSKGKSDVQRNMYLKQRRAAYAEVTRASKS